MSNKKIEIACFDTESALIAIQAGADRIELCSHLSEGGLTPTWESVLEVKEAAPCDLFVMIRPRGGDFCYTEEEFEQMKVDIVDFKRLGVQGFVFGILNPDQTIDLERNRDLLEFAHPFPCTFHRAFDRCPDLIQAMESIIELGFSFILSSGGASDVQKGILQLRELVDRAKERIQIMPGGGLRSSNILPIAEQSKAKFFHSSAILDESLLANSEEIKRLKEYLSQL